MARISAVETRDGYVVTVKGSLRSTDLRRLERACGRAIERRRPFEILVDNGTVIDTAARAYVDRLQAIGAVLRS